MTSATAAKPQCEITHEALAEQGCYPLYDMAVPLNWLERSVRQSTGRVGCGDVFVTL